MATIKEIAEIVGVSDAAVVSSLPVMIVFMFLQRFIQNGLAAGGVKGEACIGSRMQVERNELRHK